MAQGAAWEALRACRTSSNLAGLVAAGGDVCHLSGEPACWDDIINAD